MNWSMIEAIAQSVAAIIAAVAIYMSIRLHRRQMLLEQRQLLLPLWKHLQDLNQINPENPVWPDVIRAVNLLELIAVCWEGQLIDENIVRRMYSQLYLEFYDKICDCKKPPDQVGKDGKEMIMGCPAVLALYDQLISEYASKGQLKPIK